MASTDCVVSGFENVDPTMTLSATLGGITITQGGVQLPALAATWTAPSNPYITALQFEYVISGGSTGYSLSQVASARAAWAATDQVVAGATYSIRYRAIGDSVVGPWSNWVSVTVPSAFTAGTAISVSWTSVSGTPSNLTALTGTEQIQNALMPGVGVNRVPYSQFERGTGLPWFVGANTGSLAISKASGTNSGINFLQYTATATAAGQVISIKSAFFPVTPGERLAVQAQCDTSSDTTGQFAIGFLNASGGSVSEPSVGSAVAAGTVWPHAVQAFISVPAGAVTAWVEYYGTAVGAGTVGISLGQPMVSSATAQQTAFPAFNPGPNADNAGDVTSANIASGIINQGALATAALVAAQVVNTNVPLGSNAIPNSQMQLMNGTLPLGFIHAWGGDSTNLGSVTITDSVITAVGGQQSIKRAVTGTPNGTAMDCLQMDDSSTASVTLYCMPVSPGDTVVATCQICEQNAGTGFVVIGWFDKNGTYVSEAHGAAVACSLNGDTADVTTWPTASLITTVPADGTYTANVRYACIYTRFSLTGGANPSFWSSKPFLCEGQTGQTELPAYSPGPSVRQADQTSANIAAAVVNQAAIATDPTAQIGATNNVYYSQSTDPFGGGTVPSGAVWIQTGTPYTWFSHGGAWTLGAGSVASGSNLVDFVGSSSTVSGSFTVPAGFPLPYINVTLTAASGGASYVGSNANLGGGGGQSQSKIAVSPGDVISYTIGARGAAGTSIHLNGFNATGSSAAHTPSGMSLTVGGGGGAADSPAGATGTVGVGSGGNISNSTGMGSVSAYGRITLTASL